MKGEEYFTALSHPAYVQTNIYKERKFKKKTTLGLQSKTLRRDLRWSLLFFCVHPETFRQSGPSYSRDTPISDSMRCLLNAYHELKFPNLLRLGKTLYAAHGQDVATKTLLGHVYSGNNSCSTGECKMEASSETNFEQHTNIFFKQRPYATKRQ